MGTTTMVSLAASRDSVTPFRTPRVMTSAIACSTAVKRHNNASFAALPEEIKIKILEWCDFRGVHSCQLTCRALRDVVANSTSLRYKLALAEYGMCDGTPNSLSTAEKLGLLTAHAAAWRNLDSVQPEKASMLVGWSAPIAVSGNIMIFSQDKTQVPLAYNGEVRPEPRQDLLVLRVPSALRRIEAAHWVLNLPGSASESCIDVSQDLLIYVSDFKFHVCALSTGAVHPLVEHAGFFSLWKNGSRRSDATDLAVYGDYVAAATRVYFISAWNWKTGQLVSEQKSDVHFSSFSFLDEHHILYAASKEDSIYVYDLRRRVTDLHQHQHPQKERLRETKRGPVRFQLSLPPIHRATMSRYIKICRNALPTGKAQPSGGRIGDNVPPFYADARERLIVLRVVTMPVERGEERVELHVPARALLDHIAAVGRSRHEDDDEEALIVPWLAWCRAVRVTPPRRLPYTFQARMIAYGMRAVSHPPDWDEGVVYVDSYLPREGRREAGTGAKAEAVESGGTAGTRQAVRLPGDIDWETKVGLFSVLCEDALLCYKLDSSLRMITHAYWYTI